MCSHHFVLVSLSNICLCKGHYCVWLLIEMGGFEYLAMWNNKLKKNYYILTETYIINWIWIFQFSKAQEKLALRKGASPTVVEIGFSPHQSMHMQDKKRSNNTLTLQLSVSLENHNHEKGITVNTIQSFTLSVPLCIFRVLVTNKEQRKVTSYFVFTNAPSLI